MFELVNPDLVGRNLLEIVRAPELAFAVEKTFRERISTKTEFQTTTKPRKIINASVAVLSAKSDRGLETLGATVVFNDVTDLRQLETIRRDFVANVSHELKTPLASIKAYAETLRLGAIHDEQKNMAFLSQIESQAELLNRQIHDLLQLARVESGEQHWDIKAISINDLCAASVEQFQSAADSRNIKLSQTLDPRRPMAVADAEGVRTILNNLISNAIHYTPGGGSVVVSTDIDDSDVLIKVADTGLGIDPEHQARIFERFYRVDKARSREMGGTGLGLSIVKHLVMAFEGSIKLESQLGKGSTFSVRLPAAT
jgi:two-component system phosphate regulon sensor histidine kinase PhoR